MDSSLLLLLLVLDSGSWVWSMEKEIIHKEVGETLSVTCPYSIKKLSSVAKIWCKWKPGMCPNLVRTSKSRTWINNTRYMIWDDRRSGFCNVTMAKLEVQDTGFYWCGSVNHTISPIKEVSLVVSEKILCTASSKHSTDSNFLVIQLCGFFISKALLLIICLMLLSYRVLKHCSAVTAPMAAPSPAKTLGSKTFTPR